jgi:glutamate-ammonia-ligase adenylyltransferase
MIEAHELGLALQQIERVALDRAFSPDTAGPGLKAAMARAAGEADFATVEARLQQAQAAAAGAVAAVLEGQR